ncbi:hypothetical protein [Streptomyces tibetensis]|uniref:hypothetical protein n=1 Tax=Streptomyces tibetensis TaxID=2382123 RepID=UPI003F540E62
MEIDDMTPAEERVWRAFPRGQDVDFRSPAEEDAREGAAEGAHWGPERTVRAAVLRALLLSAPQEDGETAALRLAGARITGELLLQYADVDHAVRLSDCLFEDTPVLYAARLRQLNLRGSVLRGEVRLSGASVAGTIDLDEARLRVGAGEVVLDAETLTVEGVTRLGQPPVNARAVCCAASRTGALAAP